jgi:hypothetical protein
MNPELKKKWVAALRSGEFRQAREVLRQGDAYCCLGVLCTMVDGVEWTLDDALYRDEFNDTYDADGELPMPVRQIAGISTDEMTHLIVMNDGKENMRPHSFAEIADYIEANL